MKKRPYLFRYGRFFCMCSRKLSFFFMAAFRTFRTAAAAAFLSGAYHVSDCTYQQKNYQPQSYPVGKVHCNTALYRKNKIANAINCKSSQPCNGTLNEYECNCRKGGVHLTLNGCHSCHAGGVKQGEHKKAYSGHRSEHSLQKCGKQVIGGSSHQHGHGGYYCFLCGKACDKRCGYAPVVKAQRCKNRGDYFSDCCQHTL